jgi:hypothetical protein
VRQYEPGDTIEINVELEDPSGIRTVEMMFRKDSNSVIHLSYSGPDVPSGVINLLYDVTDETPSGIYQLSAFLATDGSDNRSDFDPKPDWDFEIVNDNPLDTTGPDLIDVVVQ